jgi:hypothetical protein
MIFYCILAVFIQSYRMNYVLSAVGEMYVAPRAQEAHT